MSKRIFLLGSLSVFCLLPAALTAAAFPVVIMPKDPNAAKAIEDNACSNLAIMAQDGRLQDLINLSKANQGDKSTKALQDLRGLYVACSAEDEANQCTATSYILQATRMPYEQLKCKTGGNPNGPTNT
jgi:hypothetical protein